jgi:hypothetical protein
VKATHMQGCQIEQKILAKNSIEEEILARIPLIIAECQLLILN